MHWHGCSTLVVSSSLTTKMTKNTKHCTAFLFGFGNSRLQQEMKRTNKNKKLRRKISNERVNHSFSFRFRVLISLALKIVVSIAHELCLTTAFCQQKRPVTIFQIVNNIRFWFTNFFIILFRYCFCYFFLLSHSGLNLVQFFIVALCLKWCFSSVHNNSPVYGSRW